jgi:hypothetical protein
MIDTGDIDVVGVPPPENPRHVHLTCVDHESDADGHGPTRSRAALHQLRTTADHGND